MLLAGQITQFHQIALTSSLTILGGIFVLVAGQVVIRFLIEPLQEQCKVIGRIASDLVFYARFYANPGLVEKEFSDRTMEVLRRHASDLKAVNRMIPFYGLWALLGRNPTRNEVKQASKDLIFLSNATGDTGRSEWNRGARKRIEKALHIEEAE